MQNGLLWIDKKAPELNALSKEIWNYAEVGLREEKSAAALADYLEKEGFSVQKGVGHMPTAFVASFGEGKPIIGFLGEYDSLAGLSQKTIPTKEEVVPGGPATGAATTFWEWGPGVRRCLEKGSRSPAGPKEPSGSMGVRRRKRLSAKCSWPRPGSTTTWMQPSPGTPGCIMGFGEAGIWP